MCFRARSRKVFMSVRNGLSVTMLLLQLVDFGETRYYKHAVGRASRGIRSPRVSNPDASGLPHGRACGHGAQSPPILLVKLISTGAAASLTTFTGARHTSVLIRQV